MTSQAELTLLESYYVGWIAAGMPVSYTMNGRTFTRPDMDKLCKRLDQLRAAVARSQGGGVFVAQFRDPE